MPSSRRRADGVEDDATIQHERAVKFVLRTAVDGPLEYWFFLILILALLVLCLRIGVGRRHVRDRAGVARTIVVILRPLRFQPVELVLDHVRDGYVASARFYDLPCLTDAAVSV